MFGFCIHLDLRIPINPKHRHGISCVTDFSSGLLKCLGGSPESQDLYHDKPSGFNSDNFYWAN